jgi:hypothetical protein
MAKETVLDSWEGGRRVGVSEGSSGKFGVTAVGVVGAVDVVDVWDRCDRQCEAGRRVRRGDWKEMPGSRAAMRSGGDSWSNRCWNISQVRWACELCAEAARDVFDSSLGFWWRRESSLCWWLRGGSFDRSWGGKHTRSHRFEDELLGVVAPCQAGQAVRPVRLVLPVCPSRWWRGRGWEPSSG